MTTQGRAGGRPEADMAGPADLAGPVPTATDLPDAASVAGLAVNRQAEEL